MKSITLSKRAFENLEPLVLSRDVLNTESCVLKFNYQGKPKVIKSLFYQEGLRFANKLYTLEMLSSNRKNLPSSFLVPEALISVSGNIRGFTVPYMEGVNLEDLLRDPKVSLEEKKYYLYKVGEVLNQMKAIREHSTLNDLYLCDLHPSNVLVNKDNKEIGIVDLDSCKINGNKSSVSLFLNPFALLNNVHGKYKIVKDGDESCLGYVDADENSDLYCYSMTLLSFLYGSRNINNMELEEYYKYLDYLSYVGFNGELLVHFMDLVSNKKNSNPYHLVHTITSEQACRAKCLVYEKVKKNKISL